MLVFLAFAVGVLVGVLLSDTVVDDGRDDDRAEQLKHATPQEFILLSQHHRRMK
jgi:hypothetical protein